MTRMDSLRALYDAVKAGERASIASLAHKAFGGKDYHPPQGNALTADAAFHGSVDAALAFIAATLPGWGWMMGDKGTATVIPPKRLFAERGVIGPTVRVDGNPATALLLAALAAHIQEEEAK